MNSLNGHIEKVGTNENISLVSARITNDLLLNSIVIENPDDSPYLKTNNPIRLLFKETEVIIALKDGLQIGIQNQIPAVIKKIDNFTILTEIDLESDAGEIKVIMGTEECKTLKLKENMDVIALIRANEIMLSPK